jgi:type I restriction enzyme S subunit
MYPAYKDSAISWIGSIPSEWQVKKIGHSFGAVGSGTTPSTSDEKWFSQGEIPWVTSGELRENTVDRTKKHLIPDALEAFPALQIHPKGALVIAMYGATIGRLGVLGIPATTNQACCVLSQPKSLDIRFTFYWLLVHREPIVSLFSSGGGQPNINRETVTNLRVPAPKLNEQSKIAHFLDHETAKIDTLIQEQKRLIELLKEKRQALVLSAFSLSDSVETRLANAVNLIYKPVSQKVDETYIPIGLFNRGRGLFHKDPRGIEEMGESDFFWVNDGDLIISGQFAWEGAVALAGEKEQGKVVSHRYPILRGKNGIVTTEYIFALLTTRHGDFLLNENSRGAAGRNKPLNISALLKEKITIPAFSLQNKIVEIVHQERQIKAEASRQKKLLLEHRAALISAAVTGKIDVRDWQPPADESTFDKEMRQAEIKVTA